jgi:hypothetical protein
MIRTKNALTLGTVLRLAGIAIILGAAGPAQAPDTRGNTTPENTATTDGSWVRSHFMYTNKAPKGDEWVARLLDKYAPKKTANAPPGLPTNYLVFEIIPGTRTIVAVTQGEGCAVDGNGHDQAAISAIQCPLTTITVYADGRENVRVTRPACFIPVNPADNPPAADPRTNGTYMRYDAQTGAVVLNSVIAGKPQSGCHGSAHV